MTFMLMDAQSWFCVCLACSFWCIVYCTSVHSYICIIAPYLGTLDIYVWTWSMRCWSQTLRRCSVDISRRWKDPLKQTKTRPNVRRAQGLGRINTNLPLPPGKPRCMPYYFKFMTSIYLSITCALGLGIVWNSSCMISRFPGVILVCIGQ